MATLIAWVGSGAGRMPSARANVHAGLEAGALVDARRLDDALLLEQADTSGAMPW